jgi:hypothetical protein
MQTSRLKRRARHLRSPFSPRGRRGARQGRMRGATSTEQAAPPHLRCQSRRFASASLAQNGGRRPPAPFSRKGRRAGRVAVPVMRSSAVARMEPQGRQRPSSTGYGVMRGGPCRAASPLPDCATLHPGYGFLPRIHLRPPLSRHPTAPPATPPPLPCAPRALESRRAPPPPPPPRRNPGPRCGRRDE